MRDFLAAVSQELAQGNSLCLATIIGQKGSAPRSAGSRFFVRRGGEFWGTIGGGNFEAQVIEKAGLALDLGRSELMHYRLMGADVADTEMICGGDLDVYLDPVSADDPENLALYQAAAQAAGEGGRALLATMMVTGGGPTASGRKLLLRAGHPALGSLPQADGLLAALGEELGSAGRSVQRLWDGPGAAYLPAPLLLEPIATQPVVYIFGGGHVSQKLAPLAAMAGFGLVVADDRPEWANRLRFPQAREIWNRPLETVLAGESLGPEAYIVIVTRGHLFDKEVLAQSLKQNAAYVGMIGSKRKRAMIYKALSEEGVTTGQLEQVHSPIGLAIGAETPEEIAISIIAELVAVRAARMGSRRL
ncbi:MAG: XdhC family protein [Desulfarculaceae bacterium]|nr:XdhC family protein [Desulfarculaceae bacterium]MCF8047189.1 XdhC family protein [Desulfarculaceae bacterium]MCF8096695.1 XdhC family protein [Desulfarculaceae bacterium]MCF8121302.1 XdhC family protein [Desulfarculaceae bacterium]